MITSRPILRISQEFTETPTVEIRAHDSDIKRFVAGHMDRLPRFVQRDAMLQIRIQDAIVNATDGMFLLPYLHLDSLRGKASKKALQSSLDSLPRGSKGLDKAYEEALERIDGQLPDESKLARRVLTWIVFAERPLTTTELVQALAVEPDELELDEDNIPDVEDLVSVCGGLVSLDEESDIIRLVHYTTQEYFERIRMDWNPDAQIEIASTCLTYLSFERVITSHDLETFNLSHIFNPFADYAALFWGIHAFTVQEKIQEQALRFLYNTNLTSISSAVEHAFDNCLELCQIVEGVHLAARFGLTQLLAIMIETDNSPDGSRYVDRIDSIGRTALHWAAAYGYVAVIELLLMTAKADVNAKDLEGRTPLMWAILEGHENVVKYLLATAEIDIRPTTNLAMTPLMYAVIYRQEGIAELLIATGMFNIDSKDASGCTALTYAAMSGNEAIVSLLLATDMVDINSADNRGRTPLMMAAQEGREAVVNILLATGKVHVDAKDNRQQTSLLKAAGWGNEAVIKLLLATQKVDGDSADSQGWTPLMVAADEGKEVAVEILLATGKVDVDRRDLEGYTPLARAVKLGSERVIRLLLATGKADVMLKNNHGETPLSIAMARGYDNIVKLLQSSTGQ